jgi:capsular exopolysaccharide synthesis family protein
MTLLTRISADQDDHKGRPVDRGSHIAATLESVDLQGMWKAAWRWRSLIVWTTVILTVAAIVVIYRLTPEYTASTQVLTGIQQVKIQDILSELKTGGEIEVNATEMGIIKSRKLAEKTVGKLSLENDAEFNPALRGPGPLSRLASDLQPLLRWVNGESAKVSRPGENEDLTKTIDAFLEKLKVSSDGRSRVITVSFSSVNPVTASQVVNTLADAYIVERLDQKFEATRRANIWLSDRLNTLRQELQVSEDAVEKFRNANGLLRTQQPVGQAGQNVTLTMQQMAQVSAEAITARTKYLEAQSRLAQLQRTGITRGGGNIDAAMKDDSILEVLQSPVIQALRAQEADAQRREADLTAHFGEKYPSVINIRAEAAGIRGKIQTEVNRIVEGLKNEVATQQARGQSLNAMLDKMKTDAAHNDIAEVQLHDLERQAQANRALYENFLTRFKQTESDDSYQQPEASIISRAPVPVLPSFPQKTVLMVLSVVTSFLIGWVLALICENLDVAIRSMDQVRGRLKVNALGMVPALAGVRRAIGTSRPEKEVMDRPLSAYTEAIRSIHTNLMLADVDRRPRIVLVTSALPGEGKSTMAMSLAQTIARSGQRVVVVDGDLRRPALHRLAGIAHKPGLIEWLLGRSAAEEVIYSAGPGGVDIIPAGSQPQMPPNLLSSDRFRLLLHGLTERYDMVILDSAPVLAVSDTRVLAALAERTLFVVRWASTSHKVAASALHQLFEAGATVAGVALTAVDVKAHAKDGFTDSVLYTGQLRAYYR